MNAPEPRQAMSVAASAASEADAAAPHWTQAPERSNVAVMKAMVWIAIHGGRRLARVLLVPIALYFLLFSPKQARQSRRFLKRALGRDANWIDGYRHIHSFASTILDRIYFLHRGVASFDVRVQGEDALKAAVLEDPGAFLVGGHLGSFEVLRAVGDQASGFDVAMVMYPDNARKVNEVLQAIAPDKPVPVIALGRMDSMLAVRDWLDRGGLAGILGDRSIEPGAGAQANARSVRVDFLGHPVNFIDGPMRLAALLRRRVFFMAGLYRGGDRYDVVIKPLVDFRAGAGGAAREAAIRDAVVAYARELETQAREAPYNWFNFHDFWQEDAPAAPADQPGAGGER